MRDLQTRFFVVIPAAGLSSRFGGDSRKQYLKLGGRTLLSMVVDKFLSMNGLQRVVVVLPEADLAGRGGLAEHPQITFVAGGASRAESVRNGVRALDGEDGAGVVLVHDAARPFFSAELARKVAETADRKGAAVPLVPVTDTIKAVREGEVSRTLDRELLRAAQTPQGARLEWLREAYEKLGSDYALATDESMLVERSGKTVAAVPGEAENIKITVPSDGAVAEALWARLQTDGEPAARRA